MKQPLLFSTQCIFTIIFFSRFFYEIHQRIICSRRPVDVYMSILLLNYCPITLQIIRSLPVFPSTCRAMSNHSFRRPRGIAHNWQPQSRSSPNCHCGLSVGNAAGLHCKWTVLQMRRLSLYSFLFIKNNQLLSAPSSRCYLTERALHFGSQWRKRVNVADGSTASVRWGCGRGRGAGGVESGMKRVRLANGVHAPTRC